MQGDHGGSYPKKKRAGAWAQAVAAGEGGAGWGVVVVEQTARQAQLQVDSGGGKLLHELYGPVMLDRGSPLYLGAERATNNTAELSAVVEVRRWRARGPRGVE